VHWCVHNAGSYGVESDAFFCILDCETPSHGIQAAFRNHRNRAIVSRDWLIGSVLPRAIAWVSTSSTSGVGNIAPVSFFTVVSRIPPILSISQYRDMAPFVLAIIALLYLSGTKSATAARGSV